MSSCGTSVHVQNEPAVRNIVAIIKFGRQLDSKIVNGRKGLQGQQGAGEVEAEYTLQGMSIIQGSLPMFHEEFVTKHVDVDMLVLPVV